MTITLMDLKKDSNAFFNKFIDVEARKKQIAALQYIEKMASLSATDISDWDFEKLFMVENEGRLIEHKGTLNMRLARMGENLRADIPKELAEAEQMMLRAFQAAAKRSKENRIASFTNSRAQSLREAEASANRLQSYLTNASNYYKQEMDLRQFDVGKEMYERLAKVCKNKFFKLENVDGETAYFNTTSPITLSMRNAAAGLDITVPFGYYRVVVDAHYNSVKVFKLKDNIPSRYEYWHPYVSREGRVCWGNASDTANNLILMGKWDEVMELLGGLLSTYSPDATPYHSLEAFKADYDRWKNPGQQPRCPHCDRFENSHDADAVDEARCRCYVCGNCGGAVDRETRRCDDCWCNHCESNSGCELCGECVEHIDNCTCEREE